VVSGIAFAVSGADGCKRETHGVLEVEKEDRYEVDNRGIDAGR
jgi:hypothetical protein